MQFKKVAKVSWRETKGTRETKRTNGSSMGGRHTRSWSSEMSQKRKRQKLCFMARSSLQAGWAECLRPRSLVSARVQHVRRSLVRVLARIRRLDFSCSLHACALMSVRQQ